MDATLLRDRPTPGSLISVPINQRATLRYLSRHLPMYGQTLSRNVTRKMMRVESAFGGVTADLEMTTVSLF